MVDASGSLTFDQDTKTLFVIPGSEWNALINSMNKALGDTALKTPWYLDNTSYISDITLDYDMYDDEKIEASLNVLDYFLAGYHLTVSGSIEAYNSSMQESFGWIYTGASRHTNADESQLSIHKANTSALISELKSRGYSVYKKSAKHK